MIAHPYLYFIAMGLVVIGWGMRVDADDNVTIYPAPSSSSGAATTSSNGAVAADGTPIVHKSLHRKKKKTAQKEEVAAAGKTSVTPAPSKKKTVAAVQPPVEPAVPVSGPLDAVSPINPAFSTIVPPAPAVGTGPITVTKSSAGSQTQITISQPNRTLGSGPEVETGLPVARHGTGDGASAGFSHSTGPSYQVVGTFPVASYLPTMIKSPNDGFNFTDFSRKPKNVYPWKLNIITTIFWIGEGSTPISSTTNVQSAWDEDWRYNNGGTDSPYDRDGYASAHHAATINPFYVALPFNDLAFPDKARRWLPRGWYRPPKNGKQVSACKDRWVEIKNSQGDVCYAQWEDVGPLRYDHAEYVFGNERPDTYTRAGLDVSPAVADYLNINEKNRYTRWRFVDDSDVQPGEWLKYDEEALLFKAMHDIKNDPTRIRPIQDAQRPIDEQSDIDSNKKKVGAAKG